MGIHSVYSFVLLIVLVLIFLFSNTTITKRKKLYVFIVTLLLSTLAFLFNPIKAYQNGDYTDLYRFYQTLDAIKGLPFNNNVSIFAEYNNMPVMKVLVYLISRTRNKWFITFYIMFCFLWGFWYINY